MTERTLVEAAARFRRRGEPYLVATATRTGTRMVLTGFRWLAGGFTGGCIEGDLASRAWWETREGEPMVVSIDGATDDPDLRAAFGAACGEPVEVLVERAGITGRIDALEVAERCLAAGRRGAIATIVRGPSRVGARLALVAGGSLEVESEPIAEPLRAQIAEALRIAVESGVTERVALDGAEVLIEAVRPPPRLFVLGAGHDAVPIAQLARGLGWDVVVCVAEPRHAIRERFSGAAVIAPGELAEVVPEGDRAVAVVMNHDDGRDRACGAAQLATGIGYVGVLGPRERASRMADGDARVHAIELTGETAGERALVILCELRHAIARAPAAVASAPEQLAAA